MQKTTHGEYEDDTWGIQKTTHGEFKKRHMGKIYKRQRHDVHR